MRTLVVGAGGLVGSNVVRAAQERNWTVSGTYHSERPQFDIPLQEFDLTNANQFGEILDDADPELVVNCAALTDVDRCEEVPNRALAVNGIAPGILARCCASHDVQFIHTSTDYVFDGETETLYKESAPTNPLQKYGKSKLNGEETVLSVNPEAAIARLSFVYGVHRDTGNITGFPAWVATRLRERKRTSLFTDQFFTPSRAGQVAGVLLDLGMVKADGLFHVASRSCITPYNFGKRLCNLIGLDEELLKQGTRADVTRPASRPEKTCLCVSKVEDLRDQAQPTVRDDLRAIQSTW